MLMIGTLLVEILVVIVLFDLGATHSFLYRDQTSKMIKPKKILNQVLIVNNMI